MNRLATIVTPFGPDRPWCLPLWRGAMDRVGAAASSCEVLVVDNRGVDETGFAGTLESALRPALRVFPASTVLRWPHRCPDGSSKTISAHMAALWNRLSRMIDTEWTLSLEMDVLPPDNFVAALLARAASDVGAVGAMVHSRHHGRPMAYRCKSLDPYRVDYRSGRMIGALSGPVDVDCLTFSCTLIRTEWLRRVLFGNQVDAGSRHAYEYHLWKPMRLAGQRIVCDSGLVCRHYADEGAWR